MSAESLRLERPASRTVDHRVVPDALLRTSIAMRVRRSIIRIPLQALSRKDAPEPCMSTEGA